MYKYWVCSNCGHRDDWHQTCSSETILTGDQLPCYGVNGAGCDCPKWQTGIVYYTPRANRTIDAAKSYAAVPVALRGKEFRFEQLIDEDGYTVAFEFEEDGE